MGVIAHSSLYIMGLACAQEGRKGRHTVGGRKAYGWAGGRYRCAILDVAADAHRGIVPSDRQK